MRRIAALGLALLFSLQTSASAATLTPQSFSIQPLLAAIQSSFLFAVVTGQGERYAAMHAPVQRLQPRMVHATPPPHERYQFDRIMPRFSVARDGNDPKLRIRPAKGDRDPLIMHQVGTVTVSPQVRSLHPQMRAAHPLTLAPALQAKAVLNATTPSTTGVKAWWSYASKNLAGVGHALVNVANGNLVVTAQDIDIKERGIDLSFLRAYNSQSQEGWGNNDGGGQGAYGEHWTNNLEAHIAFDATNNVLSVFDGTGARYDYTSQNGAWTPPAGMQGTSLVYGSNSCSYWWTLKSGVQYQFLAPYSNSCGWQAGIQGRLHAIYARNSKNYIWLNYWFTNNNASTFNNISQINVNHSDGDSLVFVFTTSANGLSATNGFPELQGIDFFPNSGGVSFLNTYYYDVMGNLKQVTHPGNATDDWSRSATITTLTQGYWYANGTNEMTWVEGPRYMAASTNSGGTSSDGSAYNFSYDANTPTGHLTWITDLGLMNFTPGDGLSTPLQSSVSNGTSPNVWWREEQFVYQSGFTQLTDTQGHASRWWTDSNGRVTQTSAATTSYVTSSSLTWLVTQACWDSSNNLTCSVDARGNWTIYAYDGNGNKIAIAAPQVTQGGATFRPTTLISYDQYNNVTLVCDPVVDHATGRDWDGTGTPQVACRPWLQATQYAYDYSDTAYEPYGRLITLTSPLGYSRHVTYDSNDTGLPVQIQGDQIAGQVDGTNRTPTQTFTYGSYGEVTSVNQGNGATTLLYDDTASKMHRLISTTDPDGATNYTYYNVDGTVSKTETPVQHANGTGNTYLYDADGNEVQATLTRQLSSSAPAVATVTSRFFDGEDRLVEVKQPSDQADVYTNPWITRYIYDVTVNGTGTFYGTTIPAYGNLYKTQEFLPAAAASSPLTLSSDAAQAYANGTAVDLKATAFDAIGRPVAKYSRIDQSGSEATSTETLTYDQPTSYFPSNNLSGLLTSDCKGLSTTQCSYYNYDGLGDVLNVNFSNASSPNRSATYDADGRELTIGSTAYSTPVTLTYDGDGRESSYQEATGGGVTAPALFTHQFYADGTFKGLISQSSAFNSLLTQYSYRSDGKLQSETIYSPFQGTSTTVSYGYVDPAGHISSRVQSRSESGPGAFPGATTYTYDSYQRLARASLPNCSWCALGSAAQMALTYDPQGQILAENTTKSQAFSYTTRGELRGPNNQSFFANGVPISMGDPNFVSTDYTWDALAGALVSTDQSPLNDGNDVVSIATYDSVGRMSSVNSNGDVLNRGFDAENHTVESDDNRSTTSAGGLAPQSQTLALYNWGPAGHPVRIGSATAFAMPTAGAVQYDTLHWDGDQLIFTTNSSGQADDIKIGTQADITPLDPSFNGITFWDRGPGGAIVYCHNSTGISGGTSSAFSKGAPCFAGSGLGTDGVHTIAFPSSFLWNSGENQYGSPKFPQYLHTVGIGQGKILGMNRTDGFTDGLNTFQGVRTFDSATGQWTTPDTWAGDASNPATQKSYLWNGGNPMSNSDASGFAQTPYQFVTGLSSNSTILGPNGVPVTISVPPPPSHSAESMNNGYEWMEPPGGVGGAIGGAAVGGTVNFAGGELVGGYVGEQVGGKTAGGAGYLFCGYYAECQKPPDWWKWAWAGFGAVYTIRDWMNFLKLEGAQLGEEVRFFSTDVNGGPKTYFYSFRSVGVDGGIADPLDAIDSAIYGPAQTPECMDCSSMAPQPPFYPH